MLRALPSPLQVVDDSAKLESTLCHELCHAAAWLVDGVAKPAHGDVFKGWANRAMAAFPGLQVTRCHQYEIHFAFKYECATDWCRQQYGRHSKSIDTESQRCGICSARPPPSRQPAAAAACRRAPQHATARHNCR